MRHTIRLDVISGSRVLTGHIYHFDRIQHLINFICGINEDSREGLYLSIMTHEESFQKSFTDNFDSYTLPAGLLSNSVGPNIIVRLPLRRKGSDIAMSHDVARKYLWEALT